MKLKDAIGKYDAKMIKAAEIEVSAHAEFGKSLRALRQEAGLSLREVAGKAKLSAAFISDVELGRRMLSGKSMRKLAQLL